MVKMLKEHSLVITKLKNRHGLDCAGEIISKNNDNTYNVLVYNLGGYGGYAVVNGIREEDLVEDTYTRKDNI